LANTMFIAEKGVTAQSLMELFNGAFYPATIDDDGDITVEVDGGNILISIIKSKKLIQFYALFGFKKCNMEARVALANRLNDKYILARFSVPEDRDSLIADYCLAYEGGIPAVQIISTLRMFSELITTAVIEKDDDNLIE